MEFLLAAFFISATFRTKDCGWIRIIETIRFIVPSHLGVLLIVIAFLYSPRQQKDAANFRLVERTAYVAIVLLTTLGAITIDILAYYLALFFLL